MIAKWMRETKFEYEKAKKNQNIFKMLQMIQLLDALKSMRDRLTQLQ